MRMVAIHATSLDDAEPLIQIVLKEMKNLGINPKTETPKPPKRTLVPFSTPGGGAVAATPTQGRLFGKRLTELSKLLVSLDDQTDVLVPKFVVSACTYIEKSLNVEGVYRLAGSNARQKNLRIELESSELDVGEISPAPSVLDVASLLKQFLRELPIPLIPLNFHTVLADALIKNESSLQLAVLLLPAQHLACLCYLCRHLAAVANNCAINKMTARNLAIVLTPSLLPIQDTFAVAPGKGINARKLVEGDRRLKIYTAILEYLINNASQIGYLSSGLYDKYLSSTSQPGYTTSEDNLDDDYGPSKRKSKKRIRRRSGSLSRVLSVMGKGIRAIARTTTTPSKESVHSTPLPQFGATPDYPSPRGMTAKRKASAEHDMSPTNKSQKRGGFESTFTPKMRSRTFSVKRFKRKKSEGKLGQKETFTVHADLSTPPVQGCVSPISYEKKGSPPVTLAKANMRTTPRVNKADSMEWDEDTTPTNPPLFTSQFESDYAEAKAQYLDLKKETKLMEEGLRFGQNQKEIMENSPTRLFKVEERYAAAMATGSLEQEPIETARTLARVKRRSSEGRKPRSPSERRIGVIRRRSREREEKLGRQTSSTSSVDGSSLTSERGRSPGPRRNINRSPVTKMMLTPHLDDTGIKGKLLRGRPNSANSGLEKPSPMAVVGPSGNIRIKHSFNRNREKLVVVPLRAVPLDSSPGRSSCYSVLETSKLSQSDSIASLRNDINHIIEKSFSSDGRSASQSSEGSMDVFEPSDVADGSTTRHEDSDKSSLPRKSENAQLNNSDLSKKYRRYVENWDEELVQRRSTQGSVAEVFDLSSQMANVSFNPSMAAPLDFYNQDSPVTRSQLRRQSHSFEFTKPVDVDRARPEGGIRRQSSAFEFRTKVAEPIYENFTRDVANRASIRRRNSSVKDLIVKMEMEAKRRICAPVSVAGFEAKPVKPSSVVGRSTKSSLSQSSEPTIYEEVGFRAENRGAVGRSRIPSNKAEDNHLPPHFYFEDISEGIIFTPPPASLAEEKWIDGTEFFKIVQQSEMPECGRSSIVRIRKENRGRVLNSVVKFSGASTNSQMRPAAAATAGTPRRQSARMGVLASPSLPHPTTHKRQTLTGIKTSAGSRTSSSHYAIQTVSTLNKKRDKSPIEPLASAPKLYKPRKSPVPNKPETVGLDMKKRRSPNVPSGRTNTIGRKPAGSAAESRAKVGVRRAVSSAVPRRPEGEGASKRARSRKDRRFLTIGYTDEIRSPLRECQNIQTNIKRSNSDQTPSTKKEVPRSSVADTENSYQNVQVFRTRSLKSDVMMSPSLQNSTPRNERVRRAMSERTTPRVTPQARLYHGRAPPPTMPPPLRSILFSGEATSRRSPRLHNHI